MALIDKASLLMVPSTYEAGTLYNVLPSGNRAPDETGSHSGYDQTRADFTFDRGTNAAATRVNADGLIEKYRENLLLQSNAFDTTWDTYRTTLTSGQSGYDGTNNAWLLTATDTFSARVQQSESLTGVQILSVYAKAGTANFIVSEKAGTNGFYAWFDLSNGTIGNTSGDIDTTIEDVGNGWYRCSISGNPSASSKSQFYVAETNGSTTISVGASIYIQNAQLESGLVSTDYLDSGATTAKAGVLVDLPRINYDANGENGALLLEPQRTNDIPHSEYLNAVTKSNVTITTNAATSPEGNKNAHNVVANATNSDHLFFQSSMGGSTNANTQTIYAKANGYDWIHIRFDLPTKRAFFNVANGTLGTADSGVVHTIEDAGNGWYRCSATMTTTNYVNAVLGLASADATANFLGDGTSGVLMYGWQSEEASYPTSYIPNHGTSGGVTRAADVVDGKEDSSLYNDSEGVLFVEFSALSATRDNEFRFMISDGTNNERIQIGLQTGGDLYASVIDGNSATASFNYTLPNPTQNHKIAIKYKANDCALWVDGVERGTDTNATMPSGLDVFDFYRTPNNNNYVEANVKQVIYFDEALSDSELETLTTL